MQNRPFDIAKRPILHGQTACLGKPNGINRNTLTYRALQKTPPTATKHYKIRHPGCAVPLHCASWMAAHSPPPSPSIGFKPLPRMALNCDGVMPVMALNCALR